MSRMRGYAGEKADRAAVWVAHTHPRTVGRQLVLLRRDRRNLHRKVRDHLAGIKALVAQRDALRSRIEALEALVADLSDDDPCTFDHHGYCQTHGWFETDPVCPHERARDLLAAALPPTKEAGDE